MAALEAFDLALRALLSNKSHRIDLFNSTYLNEPPEKEMVEIDTFAQFSTANVHGITILNLPDYFTSLIMEAESYQEDGDLLRYWRNLTKEFEKPLTQQIKTLYGYHERITLLDGFPNIKEYIKRAMVRIIFLLTHTVSESMVEALEKMPGGNNSPDEKGKKDINSQVEMMNLPRHSENDMKFITTFILVLTNSLEDKEWSTNIETFLYVNQNFLRLIKMALQHIGLVDRGK